MKNTDFNNNNNLYETIQVLYNIGDIDKDIAY